MNGNMNNFNFKGNGNYLDKTKSNLKLNMAPIDLKPIGVVAVTTTNDIAGQINDIFCSVFDDYYGCKISVTAAPVNGHMEYVINPELFFRVLRKDMYSDKKFYGFNPIDLKSDKVDMYDRILRVNALRNSATKVEITDDLKSTLAEFIITNNINKFDFNECFSVYTENNETFVRVTRLDVLKFFKTIYGHKYEGCECYYQATPTKQIVSNRYGFTDNWAVTLLKLNWKEMEDAAKKQGIMVQSPSSLTNNIVVATR